MGVEGSPVEGEGGVGRQHSCSGRLSEDYATPRQALASVSKHTFFFIIICKAISGQGPHCFAAAAAAATPLLFQPLI